MRNWNTMPHESAMFRVEHETDSGEWVMLSTEHTSIETAREQRDEMKNLYASKKFRIVKKTIREEIVE